MNIFRYYLMLMIGIFCLVGFILIIGSLFVALLPVILPITIILILAALFSTRRRTVIYSGEERKEQSPPASEDTIDITAVDVTEEK